MAIGAPEYEVADLLPDILNDATMNGIVKHDPGAFRHTHPDRRIRTPCTRDAGAMNATLRDEIAAAAMTFECQTHGCQAFQRDVIRAASLALPQHRRIGEQTECRQRLQLSLRR